MMKGVQLSINTIVILILLIIIFVILYLWSTGGFEMFQSGLKTYSENVTSNITGGAY